MSGAALDRTHPPAPGAIRSFDVPEVRAATLPTGLLLRTARMPRLPVVSVNLVLPAGESVLDDERAGLAVLAGDALEGGAGGRSGTELAEALEGIGARLSASTGWDATTLSLGCLAERLDEALALLADVVRFPGFPEDEVERARGKRLARIRQRAMDPASLASDETARRVYAPGVPYGRPVAGTEASVAPLGREAVRGFVETYYRPGGSGLVVVGDVDAGEVREMAERHLGSWTGTAPEARDFDARSRSRARTVHLVHRPGSVQSEIRLAHPGVPRTTPDYFPLEVGNSVLGGSFTSRLNLNLREEHGFTYGVRSNFAYRRNAGPFSVSAAVGTEVTASAVREAVREVEALVEGGPDDAEVEAARDYLAGVFPLRLETSGRVAAQVASLLVYGLPDDWLHHYRDGIRAVDAPAAGDALRRHIRPEELQVVVVGDADALREPLEGLDLGPVEASEPSGA